MKNQIALLSIFMLIAYGCNETDNGTIPVIDVLGASSGNIENLSDIAENIEYIPLETGPESLIGNLGGIVVTSDGSLFVREPVNRKVIGFDPVGNYLYALDKEGRGPGEYTGISDFDISDDGRYIFVLGGKIDIYDINGGKFDYVKTIQFDNPEKPSRIEVTSKGNNIILPYASSLGTEPYRCLILDFEDDTLGYRPNPYKYEKISNITFVSSTENIFYQLNDKVYLYNDLSDTVFLINENNEFLPHIILNTNGKLMSVQAKEDLSAHLDNFGEYLGQFIRFGYIFETGKYVYGVYSFETQNHAFVYDKTDENKYEVDGELFFTDDLSGGTNFEPRYYNNGLVYSWIDAITLKNHVDSDEFKNSSPEFPEKKQQLKEIADNLEETDNPVLIAVKLKN